MKGIDTLIRLAKRDLDELRKKQTELENQKEKYVSSIKRLQSELERERALAAKTPEMASFYGGFAKNIQEKQEKLKEDIKKTDELLALVAEQIMTAFADLKKYEIARDNFKARKKAEEARKETIELDEIASVKFIRKQKQEEY